MKRLTILAALLVAMTITAPAMAHNSGEQHECRVRAVWDAPDSSWGLPECENAAKDGDASNDKTCYCYQFPSSADGQMNHSLGDSSENSRLETPCWKDRNAKKGYRICSY